MTRNIKKLLSSIGGILQKDPREIFRHERHLVSQPFYFKGNNNKAVLLMHGWTSTPYEVRRLGNFLNESGFTVSGPMLRGHGTVPKDLEEVRWTDWQEDMGKEYLRLSAGHQKVFLVGTSLGANLAVLLAEKHPEIAGVALLAMPYRFRMEKALFYLACLASFFKRYNKKFYPPTFGSRRTITRLISYQSYPFQSGFEAFALIKKTREALKNVFQPALVMQSSHDHMVVGDNLEMIYRSLGSSQKEKKHIPRAYHTFISDIKNEHVFKDILAFIEKQ